MHAYTGHGASITAVSQEAKSKAENLWINNM